MENQTRLVWDLPLRVAHWSLVVCVAGSWATHYAGIQWFAWHRRFGYAALVLVSFRIVWGLIGTRHARFGNFVAGPRRIVAYLRERRGREWTGHSPLGALSVVAMLLLLLLQALTGLFANDEIANAGPLYGWVGQGTSNRLTGWHETNSELLLALITLHVVAVGWYVLGRRQGLLRAMLTGRKPARLVPAEESISSSRTWLAALIVLCLCAGLALAIRTAPEAAIALF